MTEEKIRACMRAILAWNKNKTWTNYKNVKRDCFCRLKSYNSVLWAIYVNVKTIWNTLSGKYCRCERDWRRDGMLQYHEIEA